MTNQHKFLKPVIKDIKSLFKHLEIDPSCDVDAAAECIVITHDHELCAAKTGCEVEFTKLNVQKQQKIINKLNTNFYDAAFAFQKMA